MKTIRRCLTPDAPRPGLTLLAAAALITGIILNRRVPPYQAVPTLRASAPTKTETQ